MGVGVGVRRVGVGEGDGGGSVSREDHEEELSPIHSTVATQRGQTSPPRSAPHHQLDPCLAAPPNFLLQCVNATHVHRPLEFFKVSSML